MKITKKVSKQVEALLLGGLDNLTTGNMISAAPMPLLDPRRTGMITASHAGEISYSKTGGGWSEATKKLVLRIAHERITGKSHAKFTGSAATDWGHKYEPEACKYFERVTGLKCRPGKFIVSKQFEIFGGTPDRLLKGSHLQVKCPYSVEVVMSNLAAKRPPLENLKQVWFEMVCTGYESGYWASYDPRIESGLNAKMKIIKIERDDQFQEFYATLGELERYTLNLCEEMQELFTIHPISGGHKI